MNPIKARNGLLLAAGIALTAPGASWAQPPEQQPAGNYIVVLQDDTPEVPQVASDHARAYGLALSHLYRHALKGYAARIPEARLAQLRSDPRVAFISEDRPVHMVRRPGGGDGSGGATSNDTLPTGVDRINAELRSGFDSPVLQPVAVIDTGSGPHSDLNIVGGFNCSSGTTYDDGNGHGTHVAGTIGAKKNGAGVIGILPGTPIYSVRVLNNAGSGTWSSVICGIDWVADNTAAKNIKVANMSLGGSGQDDNDCGNTNSDAMHKAICGATDAGVLFVVAAGNDGKDLSGFVPAAYDEVLTVTAIADFNGQPGGGAKWTCLNAVDDSAVYFSNFTSASTDAGHTIAAPGTCINSTWKGGGYKTISGTSMASPHVAGTAAACIAKACAGSSSSPTEVMQALRSHAAGMPSNYGFAGDPDHPQGDRYYGYLTDAASY